MSTAINHTHDASRRSWVESANGGATDFPTQNLPFGVFSTKEASARIGVAIGDSVLDLRACAHAGLLPAETVEACCAATLNALMALSSSELSRLRAVVFDLLAGGDGQSRCGQFVTDRAHVTMHLPASIGDYTDFYASIHHATRVGSMFRPDNPLMPNYKWLPVGYHGRVSSVVTSGTDVRRPKGEIAASPQGPPTYAPCRLLDYELEVGAFVRGNNALGEAIAIDKARDHIFGLVLLNDWSARDMQAWEYQPLGPFLAKNFATTISPWVVTAEALAPFRVPATVRPEDDPQPLPHLANADDQQSGGFGIELTVELTTRNGARARVSTSNFRDMYWTLAQMLTHHASNGCNLQPGDLLGSGTVSGPDRSESGCLLELTMRGKEPIAVGGETRGFLEDGDTVTLRGRCQREGFASIGFGECSGTVTPAA